MFKRAAVLAVSCGVLLTGCGKDVEQENQEIVSNLVKAGFPSDDVTVVDGAVYVGGDAHVTLEASREMLQSGKESQEQYRTTNLVSSTKTKICVTPTAAFANISLFSTGLNQAISRYNALGLTFQLALGPTTGCSATITAQTTTGVGGSSGFPSGGNPYGAINIGTGLTSYSQGVSTHVIMHEIGHTIGFRHSDYYNRAISCGGTASNEGTAGVGAVLINGTPATATVGGSVMNSCFRSSETGTWTGTDITALTTLY
ncbi:zinc-dependent metalloprotease [Corallococcus sp. M34]|uniref:M57 family metalloprotease n=1 Tax=Citreicoccus inhibens TaxID=2849499 RepID=UPI001C212C33|nr:M57 family metalloprotease [Citreicoccus inhibens]MBU8894003.1 zinc-dependent metalloprotease [Citreicoccus inhibens]